MVLRKITWGDIMTEPLSMEWRDIMMEPLVMKWGDIMMEPLNMELGVIMEVQLETTMGVEMGWGDMVTRFICVSPSGALESATPQLLINPDIIGLCLAIRINMSPTFSNEKLFNFKHLLQ